jgi:dTDP-4-amino-4,6-dideoxygalactose transaminase
MSITAQTAPEIKSAEIAKPAFDFLDLKAQYATIREEVMEAITRVMESQHFILGPEVKQFEEEIATKLGAKFAIGCASGTDALILALLAAEIGPGDEVITTPFSFVATAGSIVHVGAKPVFADIDPVTYNLNPALIEAAITSKTRAIMPVHLFGLPADMDPILGVARAHELVVIEDAAQAIGAQYNGHYVGSLGNFGCFSFFPSKNLGGAGDGGLITTNDAAMAERLRMLRVHGSKKRYFHDIPGTNSRLDALQAAILRVKLKHLNIWADARRVHAKDYCNLFSLHDIHAVASIPSAPNANFRHVYNQFTIRSPFRNELKEFLRRACVPSEIYYPLCLHLQLAFARLGHSQGDFPVSELASSEVLSLPIFPELSSAQQELVVRTISAFFSARNLRDRSLICP